MVKTYILFFENLLPYIISGYCIKWPYGAPSSQISASAMLFLLIAGN